MPKKEVYTSRKTVSLRGYRRKMEKRHDKTRLTYVR